MKVQTIAFAALCTLPLVPVIRSQVSDASSQVPSRVGTISLQGAIVHTAEGKQASAELQSQFAARSTELQNLQKQIEELQTRLQSNPTLSDEEKERLQRQGERLTRTYQRKQQYFQDDLNAAQQDALNSIGRKLEDVLTQYSKQNGYSVILDTSLQQTPVVYGAPQVDVTQNVVRLYDDAHPAKPTVSKPTTPKQSPTPKP